jgi:hypothetical protein
MAVRVATLGTAALYPQEDSWYSFMLRGWVDPWVIVPLEGLCKLGKK